MNTATAATQLRTRIFRYGVPPCLLLAATVVGCSKSEAPATATTQDSSNASPAPTSSGFTSVRGTLANVTDSALTVSSTGGDVRVAFSPSVEVYERVPADIAQVKENSFVGVTSVAQPDGTQRATEIHIFPEKLRGTNEGSFLMGQQRGGGGGGTMTNGTVAGSRMTNGSVAGSRMTNGNVASPRMTNGTVSGQAARTLSVQYRGGSQTIAIPSDVSVTAVAPTQTRLTAGSRVVVLATKQPDGTLKASAVMMGGGPGPKK